MAGARFSIGIDLGTTNCVLAYLDLESRGSRAEVLAVPQLQTLDTLAASGMLPSCYYFAADGERVSIERCPIQVPGRAAVIGSYARAQLGVQPDRVIHSAKSWLAHSGIDREAAILPFGSEAVAAEHKCSPVQASASYLAYLKSAWDAAYASQDPALAFERQKVVITVPASFDEGAQALTRKSAELAGYPAGVRLLEEPQAAFYNWSEQIRSRPRRGEPPLLRQLPGLAERAQTVLVCDMGGGTTDLSLFEIAPWQGGEAEPQIRRIAVSDHLLLGGDNIDLALAHALEAQLAGGGEGRLSRRQWAFLVPQASVLKERVLAAEGPEDEVYHVSIPGSGHGLFASALSTTLNRGQVHEIVLEGFFPRVAAGDRPRLRQAGLREIGLPYAADTAVSRHLAAFLDGQAVDAVLFAGGSMTPLFLQQRLLGIIEAWQGRRPARLALADLNLAIAQGAAFFGTLSLGSRRRIQAGAARSVYLELQRGTDAETPQLVCVLPQGFQEGGKVRLAARRFSLLLNQPVRFIAYTSTHRPEEPAGAVIPLAGDQLQPLPPMHTTLRWDEADTDLRKLKGQSVEVHLEAELNPLGVLEIALVNADGTRRWRLDFNLRGRMTEDAAAQPGAGPTPSVPAGQLRCAAQRIDLFYGKKLDLGPKDHPKTLVKDLEGILGTERGQWDLATLRALWPALYPGMTRRGRSLAHENTWLYLAGFVLRPGYGAELDPWRVGQLWSCHRLGIQHKDEKSTQSNWWMMWRRVAGGLSAEQQLTLYRAVLPLFRKSPLDLSEGTRLLGSLERLPVATKGELARAWMQLIVRGKATRQPQVVWSLARVLSRVPLYAAAEAVVPAGLVEALFAEAEPLDWKQERAALVPVFSAACRRVEQRALDVHEPVRLRVIDKLREAGARAPEWQVVQSYHAVTREERDYLFGETMPVGLRLAGPG